MSDDFTVDISKFADMCVEDINRVVQITVIEIQNRVKVKSPVGNPDRWKHPRKGYVGGRFRNNWFYGEGEIPAATTEAVGPGGGAPMAAPGPDAWQKKHYIVNNLPYARPLEDGHSKQAPQGMVALTMIEAPSIVDQAAAAVRDRRTRMG